MLGETSDQALKRSPKTIERYTPQIDFVTARLGSMGVARLEQVATALYVTRESDAVSSDVATRAQRLHTLKPHIPVATVCEAITAVDGFIRVAHALRTSAGR